MTDRITAYINNDTLSGSDTSFSLTTPRKVVTWQDSAGPVNITGASPVAYAARADRQVQLDATILNAAAGEVLITWDAGTLTEGQWTIEHRITLGGIVSGARWVENVLQSIFVDPAGPPVSTGLPVITGATTDGATLTATAGTWTGTTPITYAYQWQRDGSNISGATSAAYVIAAADLSSSLRVIVTATNSEGSATATSAATSIPVPAEPPANTVLPAITGTAEIGVTLTSSTGTWTGTAPITYAYQWQRDGVAISGTTAATYALQAADDGADVRCVVTATNAAGSASANSAAVAVTYPAPTATGSLADVSITLGGGNATRDAGALFTGAVGGAWSVTVNGSVNASVATIDAAGVVTVLDDAAISAATVVATYTNSGGSAFVSFAATVAAVPTAPTFTTQPTITPASGPVGTEFTIDEGVANGTTPITLTATLTLDGVDVTADVVGLTYTSTSEGDLVLSVTASNGTLPNATATATATVANATNTDTATIAAFSAQTGQIPVFDVGFSKGLNEAVIALPDITTGAADGTNIEARVVNAANGAEIFPWRVVGQCSTGALTGATLTQTPALRSEELKVQTRVQGSSATVGETANSFYTGHVIDLWGQSELHRAVLNTHPGNGTPPTITDTTNLQVSYSDAITVDYGTNLKHRVVGGPDTNINRKLGALSNMFATERPGDKFHIVFHTLSSTGVRSVLSDGATGRDWTQEETITAYALGAGQKPGVAIMDWYAADSSTLRASFGDYWTTAISGLLPDGTPHVRGATVPPDTTTMDHYFADIYDYSRTKWVIAGPHRFELFNYDDDIPACRGSLDLAFANNVPLQARAIRSFEHLSYQNAPGDELHPFLDSQDGMPRFMVGIGYGILDGIGAGYATPVLDNWTYDGVAGTLTIGSSSGPITTTRIARAEALPAGRPAVDNVFKNGLLVPVADVAVTAGNIVVSNIANGDVVIIGDGGVGSGELNTTDVTDVAEEAWKDWPIVDLGQSVLEGMSVRGRQVVPDGIIPAVVIPADPNTNPNLLTAPVTTFESSPNNQTSGWYSVATGLILADNTLTADATTLNVKAYASEPNTAVDVTGLSLEASFVVTSPDGGSGSILIIIKQGATEILRTGDVPVTLNARNTFAFTGIPADNTRLDIQLNRRNPVVGTLVFSDFTIKEV